MYSIQLGKFIDCTLFASSFLKKDDQRTHVYYFIDKDGYIHSQTFNYSLVQAKPLNEYEFKNKGLHDPAITVIYR